MVGSFQNAPQGIRAFHAYHKYVKTLREGLKKPKPDGALGDIVGKKKYFYLGA